MDTVDEVDKRGCAMVRLIQTLIFFVVIVGFGATAFADVPSPPPASETCTLERQCTDGTERFINGPMQPTITEGNKTYVKRCSRTQAAGGRLSQRTVQMAVYCPDSAACSTYSLETRQNIFILLGFGLVCALFFRLYRSKNE